MLIQQERGLHRDRDYIRNLMPDNGSLQQPQGRCIGGLPSRKGGVALTAGRRRAAGSYEVSCFVGDARSPGLNAGVRRRGVGRFAGYRRGRADVAGGINGLNAQRILGSGVQWGKNLINGGNNTPFKRFPAKYCTRAKRSTVFRKRSEGRAGSGSPMTIKKGNFRMNR